MERLLRSVVAPLVAERFVRDVDVAPDAVAARVRDAINRPPKRMFGVLKVTPQWIGVVAAHEFVVWEKQDHATRAHGRIRGRRGGSRVEVELELTRGTRVLAVLFFALFAVTSLGFLLSEGGLGVGPLGLGVASFGGLAIAAFFWSSSRRQRAALRAFLDRVIGGEYRPPA